MKSSDNDYPALMRYRAEQADKRARLANARADAAELKLREYKTFVREAAKAVLAATK